MFNLKTEELNIYYHFLVGALTGINCKAMDALLRKQKSVILKVSNVLAKNLNTPDRLLHRGIIVEDSHIDFFGKNLVLKPYKGMEYLSFSEDIEVAKEFADRESDMSKPLATVYPEAKGYLIEARPPKNVVLFHWSWAEYLGLQNAVGIIDMELIKHQKEVITIQQGDYFKVEPYKH